jgi:monovalent cation:H+ antiporter, CPA1 family
LLGRSGWSAFPTRPELDWRRAVRSADRGDGRVSVLAAFNELKVRPRLSLLVESESLLNDGAAAVGFGILVTVAAGSAGSLLSLAGSLIWTIASGIAAGVIVASPVLMLAARTEDHLVEITLTTIAAYGSFLLADHIAMSGVLASLTAGLLVECRLERRHFAKRACHVLAFWE